MYAWLPAAVITVVLLAVVPASAQDDAPADFDGSRIIDPDPPRLVEALGNRSESLNFANAFHIEEIQASTTNPVDSSCDGAAEVEISEDEMKFWEWDSLEDGANDGGNVTVGQSQGCAIFYLPFNVESGASSIVVQFNSTRGVEFSTFPVLPNFEQSFLFEWAGENSNEATGKLALHGDNDGAFEGQKQHTFATSIASSRQGNLTWIMRDLGDGTYGAATGVPTTTISYSSNISTLKLVHVDVPVQISETNAGAPTKISDNQTHDFYEFEYFTTFRVPAGGLSELSLIFTDNVDNFEISSLSGQGIVVGREFERENLALGTKFTRKAPIGEGVYEVRLTTSNAIAIQLDQEQPIWPIPIGVVALALGTATGAGISLHKYRRDVKRAKASDIRRTTFGVTLAYEPAAVMLVIGIISLVYFFPIEALSLAKIDGRVTAAYVGILGLAILFLALWLVIGTSLRPALNAAVRDKIMVAKLEKSNQDLEKFAYVASHDLQEPLRKVSSFTKLFADENKDHIKPGTERYMEIAIDGSKRLQVLIEDLLQFSRVGRSDAPRTEVDLNTVFEAARHNLNEAIEEAGGEIVIGNLSPVRAVAGDMERLAQNLLGNAIKYRHPDRKCRVEVSSNTDGRLVTIKVADNGIGIPEGKNDRIFEVFQRLHSKSKYKGTGIGLAICRRIVDDHGGRIWVESDGENGSTFFVALPAH